MSEPFVGEIRPWGFNWAPEGWLLCQGQLLPVQQYLPLYSLLGNTYGGTPNVNFAVPDLRGRAAVGQGYLTMNGSVMNPTPYLMGQNAGAETVAITSDTMPMHSHGLVGLATNGTQTPASGNLFAQPVVSATDSTPQNLYGAAGAMTPLSPEVIGTAGGSASHENMQPFTVTNFCICYRGVFPPRP